MTKTYSFTYTISPNLEDYPDETLPHNVAYTAFDDFVLISDADVTEAQVQSLLDAWGDPSSFIVAVDTGFGNDTVIGSAYRDSIFLGFGDNIGIGGDGDDEIFTEGGKSSLDGGNGNDLLYAEVIGSADISMVGGEGDDRFEVWSLGSTDAKVLVDGGNGNDTVSISNRNRIASSSVPTIDINLGSGADTIEFSAPYGIYGVAISELFHAQKIRVADFNVDEDVIDVLAVIQLLSPNYFGGDLLLTGHVVLTSQGGDTLISVDLDGALGAGATVVPVMLLQGVDSGTLSTSNFKNFPVSSRVRFGIGNDNITGDSQSNYIYDSQGSNSIYGDGGADFIKVISQSQEKQFISGGAGDDWIQISGVGKDASDIKVFSNAGGAVVTLGSLESLYGENFRYLGLANALIDLRDDPLETARKFLILRSSEIRNVEVFDFNKDRDQIDLSAFLALIEDNDLSKSPFETKLLTLTDEGDDSILRIRSGFVDQNPVYENVLTFKDVILTESEFLNSAANLIQYGQQIQTAYYSQFGGAWTHLGTLDDDSINLLDLKESSGREIGEIHTFFGNDTINLQGQTGRVIVGMPTWSATTVGKVLPWGWDNTFEVRAENSGVTTVSGGGGAEAALQFIDIVSGSLIVDPSQGGALEVRMGLAQSIAYSSTRNGSYLDTYGMSDINVKINSGAEVVVLDVFQLNKDSWFEADVTSGTSEGLLRMRSLLNGKITFRSGPGVDFIDFIPADPVAFLDSPAPTVIGFQGGAGGDVIELDQFFRLVIEDYDGLNPFLGGQLKLEQQTNGDTILWYRASALERENDEEVYRKLLVLEQFAAVGLTSDNFDMGFGTPNDDDLRGGDESDVMFAAGGNDTIESGAGDDYVDAGDGDDLIVGGNGAGNDEYVGGKGIDTIRYTSATAGLFIDLGQDGGVGAAYSSDSTLQNSAGIGVDILRGIENVIGGNFNDRIYGNEEANTIEGCGGNDNLFGRGGSDTVSYSSALGGVRVDISEPLGSARSVSAPSKRNPDPAGIGIDTIQQFENITGSSFGDVLIGNREANILDGRGGSDTLTGGSGADHFLFTITPTTKNADRITDFESGIDKLVLSKDIFTRLADGFTELNLRFGAKAINSDDFIIFDARSSTLFYDADGSGRGKAIAIATLTGVKSLEYGDFLIV